jgi:hypothetical protein
VRCSTTGASHRHTQKSALDGYPSRPLPGSPTRTSPWKPVRTVTPGLTRLLPAPADRGRRAYQRRSTLSTKAAQLQPASAPTMQLAIDLTWFKDEGPNSDDGPPGQVARADRFLPVLLVGAGPFRKRSHSRRGACAKVGPPGDLGPVNEPARCAITEPELALLSQALALGTGMPSLRTEVLVHLRRALIAKRG